MLGYAFAVCLHLVNRVLPFVDRNVRGNLQPQLNHNTPQEVTSSFFPPLDLLKHK